MAKTSDFELLRALQSELIKTLEERKKADRWFPRSCCKAKTRSGREIYIMQFINAPNGVFAVTVDDRGDISLLPAEQLTVIDTAYVKEV